MVESSEYSSILERLLFSRHTHPSDSRLSTSSIYKMHTTLFNPSTSLHQHHHKNSRQQQFPRAAVRTTGLSPASSTSSMMSLLKVPEPIEVVNGDRRPQATQPPPNLEADKIQRNSLYLTFNAPQVDDYHRGIFLTNPPGEALADTRYSGTLFHASYAPLADDPKKSTWTLEQRPVRDVTSSASLCLVFRLGALDTSVRSIDEQVARVSEVLGEVPLGRQDREQRLGPLKEGEGNPVLAGYDCIVWTKDAMSALEKAGLIDMDGKTADELMAYVRAIAGPPDAKSMVGVDFGGFKVVNEI